MGRTAGSNGPRTAAAIRRAGLRLIYRHGYEAMTLRALAAEVGIQAASLYNHIRSKQDLLFDIVRDHMETLLARTDAALATATGTPTDRLRAFVAHHVTYHLEKRQEVFIANFELRSLDPPHYAAIVALRRAYEDRLVALLERGSEAGELDVRDARVAGYAILGMLTSACTWYRPDGRMTKAEIVALHTDMALRGCVRRQP
ncbi:TetR family transcriptional regulator [Methylobacterium sp. Leaf361]|uniref:TetR/AcrR family transcriptional regulator n=1 Tax=unclassified Methylobacterium TaxID=2615210 RepID=UPI0006F4AA35|nr:TetR/AcrR family transcriptional regulator [Methylobacterium sp. Leaf361]KQS69543.1 TetR family transcriptional regulator [Methylobacterium sp. Leaf361]